MNIDKYLYEIIDGYKKANLNEDKAEIFKDFCSSIWNSKNKRRIYTKTIRFKVRSDLLESEIGQIFNAHSEINYTGYKSMTKETDWCSLLRQKINNLYTRYFDEEVILNKDYMNELKIPYNLYYRWIKGMKITPDELIVAIDNSISKAAEIKVLYQKQKIKLSWDEYKIIIEEFLYKAFNNCKLIEDYEIDNLTNKYIYELANEDNFYISYICRSIEGEMLKWQKRYYKVRDHKKYKRCKICGSLIEKVGRNTQYCAKCKEEKRKETKRNWWNKNR